MQCIPRVKLLLIFRQRASVIVNINGHRTVTDAGAYVGTTDMKEVWTQSPDGELEDICDGLIYSCTEQESANHLVTVDNETWN